MKLQTSRMSRFAGAAAVVALLATGAAKPAAASDLATTLASNPQFSDFVTQLRTCGLWSSVVGAQNVTIFAPTNAAIEKTPGWRTKLIDAMNTASTYGSSVFSYQNGLRGAVIRGVHPVSDFAGKAQAVHSLGDTTYWVDGREGSVLQVAGKPPSVGMMGADPAATHTATLGAPISADNGMIYPVDAVVR